MKWLSSFFAIANAYTGKYNKMQSQSQKESPQKRPTTAHVISINVPSSPAKITAEGQARKVSFSSEYDTEEDEEATRTKPAPKEKSRFYTESHAFQTEAAAASEAMDDKEHRERQYALFKTKSGKLLDRKLSRVKGKPQADETTGAPIQNKKMRTVPTKRYYDALSGPELEDIKDSEVLILPRDKTWPFLLRFPISCFGISLGVASQAILYKNLAAAKSMQFLHIPDAINLVLWCLGVGAICAISVLYICKCIFYLEAVKREYYHPVRVNFFFAPWIACMFLAIGLPPMISKSIHPAVWCVLMFPVLCLELKIYGQWMSGGQRRLSKVANPSNHLSIVGNFVGALLGAVCGWKEAAIFFFAVGVAHYSVVFVTLYQRLPTNETLPKDLHPVFFLFVAAPSVASVAWEKITGEFGYVSKLTYFIALFLYTSLVVRINFFRGFSFNISWWAYTFPMTGAAIATIRYSNAVTHPITQTMAVVLSVIASITVFSLLVTTFLNAFLWKQLFPNDFAIAIAHKKHKHEVSEEESNHVSHT